ncbi:MAG: CHASE2 domain-containing protein, partial [Betaproteobacteria bacterium]|nr:CHASE2 domain-containing protein [Betaproteobacteria bacterium]
MDLVARLRHPVIREWLLIVVALGALIFFAVRGDWFGRVDQTMYDRAINLLERPADRDIVIVGIDEPSLKQLGRWPWPRNIHATLLDKLTAADVKVVILDIILSEPDRTSPDADAVLAKSIGANGRVVLPITKDVADRDTFAGQVFGELLPVAAMAGAAAKLAHIGQQPDADGVLRSVYLRSGAGSAQYDISPLAALRIISPVEWGPQRLLPGEFMSDQHGPKTVWKNQNLYQIPFAGPPGHFERIPYIDILRGDVPATKLKDKIVFVGATAPSMRDEFPAPVSGNIGPMPGVEVQANVLQGLRENMDLRLASRSVVLVLSCTLVLGVMLGYLWLTPRMSLALTGVLGALVLAVSALAFKYLHFWMPPAVTVAALLLAYPLWSWRKLEATQRYFDAELAHIARERVIVPEEIARKIAPSVSANGFVPDVIESRISTLQATSQRLRNLNRFVADSLESLPDATLVTDANGRILLANSSADRLFKARRRGGDRGNDPPLEGRDLFDLMAQFQHADTRSWREIW